MAPDLKHCARTGPNIHGHRCRRRASKTTIYPHSILRRCVLNSLMRASVRETNTRSLDMDDSALAQAVSRSLPSFVVMSLIPFHNAAFFTCWTSKLGQHLLYERYPPGYACHSGIANRSAKVYSPSIFILRGYFLTPSIGPLFRACLRRLTVSIQTWQTRPTASHPLASCLRCVLRSHSLRRCPVAGLRLSRVSGAATLSKVRTCTTVYSFGCANSQ